MSSSMSHAPRKRGGALPKPGKNTGTRELARAKRTQLPQGPQAALLRAGGAESAGRLRRTSLCAKGSRGWGFVLQRGFRTRARVWGASEDAPHQKVRDGPAVAAQGGVLALPGANSRSPSRPSQAQAGRDAPGSLPTRTHLARMRAFRPLPHVFLRH